MHPSTYRISITAVPLLPYLLWRNAGFGSLRNREELDHIGARFDPTVIAVVDSRDHVSGATVDPTILRVPPKSANGRFYSIADFHDAYRSGKLTPTDVVEYLLPLIRRDVAQRSPHSTAFVDSRVDFVRSAAAASTTRWKEGKPLGILDGVPFAAKDDLNVKGYKRYVGTKRDFNEGKEAETSWCVRKVEEEGAVLIGKFNMHELGMGEVIDHDVADKG